MLIIAHRGNHDTRSYPENTREALNLAYHTGAHGVEIDLRITRDDSLALMHDPSTGLVANRDLDIAQHSRSELALATLKGRLRTSNPTLLSFFDEIFPEVPPDAYLFIELKDTGDYANRALTRLKDFPLDAQRHRFITFYPDTLIKVRTAFPIIPAYLLGEAHQTSYLIAEAQSCNAHGIDIQISGAITREYAALVKKNGLSLHVWGVSTDEDAAQAFEAEPESITTDRPHWLMQKVI